MKLIEVSNNFERVNDGIKKHFLFLGELFFNINKTTKHKEKYHYSWLNNFNTVALTGINLYSVLFLYLFIQFFECSC